MSPFFSSPSLLKTGSAILSALAIVASTACMSHATATGFTPILRYTVDGSVAEIISANSTGTLLAYSNASDQRVGMIDITDVENPVDIGSVDVSDLGEPTSVALTPNDQYAVVAVLDTGDTLTQGPGHLVFIEVATLERVAQLPLMGIGPDSLAITPDGATVVVAIEDEEDEEALPGDRPGSVNIVTLDYENPAASTVVNVALDLTGIDGVNYVSDPQPEFVAINPEGTLAAISLQENNAIALIDVASASVATIFSAGTSVHDRADMVADGVIDLSEPFEGRREPDTIAFTPDGQYLLTLNEGDTDRARFGDGIWSGGRGWSLFALDGTVVYDSGSDAEVLAVQHGRYPDDRSGDRGIELEGGTTAVFGDRPYAVVASERGNFLLVYDITDVTAPNFISFLPTGVGPEGVLALPERNLLLTSNEEDGTIDIFQEASH